MLGVSSRVYPSVNVGFKLNKAVNPDSTAPGNLAKPGLEHKSLTQRVDQVRFGKIENISGPIPPNSLVILVPGMFSPASSMRPLFDYLKPRGQNLHILESPYNIKADSALASTDWLTHNIDRVRLSEASTHYVTMMQRLSQIPATERVEAARQELRLEDNELGNASAKAVLGLMFKKENNYEDSTDFTKVIQMLRKSREARGGTLPPETTHKQLYSLTAIARKELRRELAPIFFRPRQGVAIGSENDAMEKTIDHVMDQIAPRVVLVGHSMGGFVSMLTLFEQMRDTSMVIGLSAPGENGTNVIPKALHILTKLPQYLQRKGREIVDWAGPAMKHMQEGSPETQKLKANHQPFNTTILAVGMPEDYDGLVGEKNFRMNDELPGRVNVIVSPRQANMVSLVSQHLGAVHQYIRQMPPYSWAANFMSDFLRDVSYHCGLLQHNDQYWKQDGDILRGLLESPRNPEGQLDYEHGQPDYEEAVKQIRRIIAPTNTESERQHIMTVLLDNLQDAQKDKPAEAYQKMLEGYRPLLPDLKAISKELQPIHNGAPTQAKVLYHLLKPPVITPPGSSETQVRRSANSTMHTVIETSQMIARRKKQHEPNFGQKSTFAEYMAQFW